MMAARYGDRLFCPNAFASAHSEGANACRCRLFGSPRRRERALGKQTCARVRIIRVTSNHPHVSVRMLFARCSLEQLTPMFAYETHGQPHSFIYIYMHARTRTSSLAFRVSIGIVRLTSEVITNYHNQSRRQGFSIVMRNDGLDTEVKVDGQISMVMVRVRPSRALVKILRARSNANRTKQCKHADVSTKINTGEYTYSCRLFNSSSSQWSTTTTTTMVSSLASFTTLLFTHRANIRALFERVHMRE